MLKFLNNKTNKTFQKGSAALIVIGALLIITAAALGVFNGIVPKTTVEVETPKTKAEQKPLVKQTKTSFGAVQGLTKNLLNLNSEITSRSLAQEEKDLKIANLTGAVRQRKILIKELMKENPRAFLATALRKNQRSSLPQDIQKDIEQETVITAKIEVLHIDDFENPENSRFEYFLQTKDIKLNFYPTEGLYLVSGAEVKINGFQLDDVVVADVTKNNFQVTKEAPPLESVGDQKTLVLLVNFLDSPPVPFTKERAYDLVFNGQFQKFYKEQSYNQVSFSGDVYGWVTLPKNNFEEAACGAINNEEIKKIITDNNIDLKKYGRLLILPFPGGGGCSFVGKPDVHIGNDTYNLSIAYIGFLSEFNEQMFYEHPFKWTPFDDTLSHEMGHSLGVMHANGWDCDDRTLYGDCKHFEYGNYFDTMGVGQFSLHFNAFHKERLGWIKPDRSLLISQSGRYIINPLELDNGKNLAKIKVKNTTITPFYLEYRKGIGFDAKLNEADLSSNQLGLFVNKIIKNNKYSLPFPSPRLLDMDPQALIWESDLNKGATLNINNNPNIFTDYATGVVIGPIVNVNNSSITFDVEIGEPTCIRQEPFLQFYFDPGNSAKKTGETGYLQFQFINQDSLACSQSNFGFTLEAPSSWQYFTGEMENIPLIPGEEEWKFTSFIVPQDAIDGDYPIKFEITNLDTGLKNAKEAVVHVLGGSPIIYNVSPVSGQVGTEVEITGERFSFQHDLHLRNAIKFFSDDAGTNDNVISDDGKTLRFKIPHLIIKNECEGGNCFTPVSPGAYHLQVRTNFIDSNTVDFKVVSLISFTTPKDGDIVALKAKVNISADVSDEIKAKTERVEFYVNGARKCQDKTAPYSCNWTVPRKSGQTYELQAKAFGNRKLYGVKPMAESEKIKVKSGKNVSAKDDTQMKDDVEIDN